MFGVGCVALELHIESTPEAEGMSKIVTRVPKKGVPCVKTNEN